MLQAQPNTHPNVSICSSVHHVTLPTGCCPVSHNPREGSWALILYQPRLLFLEVFSLQRYLNAYRGGLRDATKRIIVRDMEGMIQQIAQDCANTVCVPVTVGAYIVLQGRQSLTLIAQAMPHG